MRQNRLRHGAAGASLQRGIEQPEQIDQSASQMASPRVERGNHELCDDGDRHAEREHDHREPDQDVNGFQHARLSTD
jgi:hypothetical protein